MSLYVIGTVVMDTPAGLNPQDVDEEAGADFAVKPVVGAQQPREFVGPADTRLTIAGTIYPFLFANLGLSSGQNEYAALKAYAAAGEPVPVSCNGVNLGFFLVEHVQRKHRLLSKIGIGRQQQYVVQLVQSPTGPSADNLVNLVTGLVGLLGSAAGSN